MTRALPRATCQLTMACWYRLAPWSTLLNHSLPENQHIFGLTAADPSERIDPLQNFSWMIAPEDVRASAVSVSLRSGGRGKGKPVSAKWSASLSQSQQSY